MSRNNPKIIAFIIGLIFTMAAITGSVTATNYINPVNNIQSHTTVQTVLFHENSNYFGFYVKNKSSPINNLAKGSKGQDHSQLFKQHQKGVENLRTISAGGIPPKGFDEIVADNIIHMKSMAGTFKTKIIKVFSKYKKFR